MTDRNAVFAELASELRSTGAVTVRGFGTFKVKGMAARTARNPKTGETFEMPPHNKLTFKPAKAIKETLV